VTPTSGKRGDKGIGMGYWMGVARHDHAEILALLDHPAGGMRT